MNGYLSSPLEFLISTLFGLYILAVMLRFVLQWVRADFYNPISQFIVKVTSPPLKPLRRVIPGLAGLDMAALVLMLILQFIALSLVFWIRDFSFAPGPLLVLALAELLNLALNVFLFAVLIQAVLSWVNPGSYSPVNALLHSLTAPVLRPARRLIPPVSGLDLSPIAVLIALQLLKMLLIPPLRYLALG